MPAPQALDDPEGGLPPPGQRSGAGAQSVLPYLTKTLQARPANPVEPREARPAEGPNVLADWPPGPAG